MHKMDVSTWNELAAEGYKSAQHLGAALPMRVWALDLEVERRRAVTGAEVAVLRLLDAGVTEASSLSSAMGLGDDVRLVERTLVKLLRAGAVETLGEGFCVTEVGVSWREEGTAKSRERITAEVRLDPVHDKFEWVDYERSVYATSETWTIQLPQLDDEGFLQRRSELGKLIAEQGLPDEEDLPQTERRGAIDLRSVAILSRRVHWRGVRVEVMEHPRQTRRLVGYVSEAENPPLTRLLWGHVLLPRRKWIRKD